MQITLSTSNFNTSNNRSENLKRLFRMKKHNKLPFTQGIPNMFIYDI